MVVRVRRRSCAMAIRLVVSVGVSILVVPGQNLGDEPGRSERSAPDQELRSEKASSAPRVAGYAKRVAVVIGVQRYDHWEPPPRSIANARAVARVLHDRFGFATYLLTDQDAPDGKAGPVTAQRIKDLLGLVQNDLNFRSCFVFYYTGHGARPSPGADDAKSEHAYIIPSDGQAIGGGTEDWLDIAEQIVSRFTSKEFEGTLPHHSLMLLDCCYSAATLREGSGAPRRVRDAAKKWADKDPLPLDKTHPLHRVIEQPGFQVIAAGLEEVDASPEETVRRFVQNGLAYREFSEHSPFTAVLLRGLRGRAGLASGRLFVSELANYMYGQLLTEDPERRLTLREVPRYARLSGDGDLLLEPVNPPLDPRLLAPLDLSDPRYADLRAAACQALVDSILDPGPGGRRPAAPAGTEVVRGWIAEAIPALAQPLNKQPVGERIDRRDQRVQLEAARALERLAGVAIGRDLAAWEQAVAPLAGGVATDLDALQRRDADPLLADQLRHTAAHTLALIDPRFVDEAAVRRVAALIDSLDDDWRRRRSQVAETYGMPIDVPLRMPSALRRDLDRIRDDFLGRPVPEDAGRGEHTVVAIRPSDAPRPGREPAGAAPRPSERLKLYDAERRRFLRLSPRELENDRARHVTGIRFAIQAERLREQQGDNLEASLIVARAIGFEGVGRPKAAESWRPEFDELLWPGSAEWYRAADIAAYCPSQLRWVVPGQAHHTKTVYHIAASSGPAGRVVSVDEGANLRCWDDATGRLMLSLRMPRTATAVAVTPDGHIAAATDKTGVVRFWDLESGQSLFVSPMGEGYIRALAFSPDARWLAACEDKGGVVLYDREQRHRLWRSVGHVNQALDLKFLGPEEVVSAGRDGRVWLWSVGGERRATPLTAPTREYRALAIDARGRRVAAGDETGGVYLWDRATDQARLIFKAPDGVRRLAFDAEGRTLAVLTRDQKGSDRLVLWSDDGTQPRTLPSPERTTMLTDLVFDTSSRCVVSHFGGKLDRFDVARWRWEPGTPGHLDDARAVAYRPPLGDELVSAGDDGFLRFWNSATGRPRAARPAHDAPIRSVAFSRDGRLCASAAQNGLVRIWQVDPWEKRHELPHDGREVRAVAFGRGERLASADGSGRVQVWEGPAWRGRQVTAYLAPATCVAFAPGGDLLASANKEGDVRLTELNGGGDRSIKFQLGATMIEDVEVNALAFSRDGSCLYVGFESGVLGRFELATGRSQIHLTNHVSGIVGLSASPAADGLVLTGGRAGDLKLWDCAGWPPRLRAHLTLGLPPGSEGEDPDTSPELYTHQVALHPSGDRAAVADGSGAILSWAVEPDRPREIRGHDGRLWTVAMDHRGRTIAAGDSRGRVFVWDPKEGRLRHSVLAHFGGTVGLAIDSQDRGAIGGNDGRVLWWDGREGDPREIARPSALGPGAIAAEVHGIAISGAGDLLATVRSDGHVGVWDVPRRGWRWEQNLGARPTAVALSRQGDRLVTGDEAGQLVAWAVADGKRRPPVKAHAGGINAVAFAADGLKIASAGGDKRVRIWDAGLTGSRSLTERPFVVVFDLKWSADGRRLAVAAERVSVWDVEGLRPILPPTAAWQVNRAVALDPGGRRLAVGGNDGIERSGAVRVLDVDTGAAAWSVVAGIWAINDLAFTNDGGRLIGAGQDGTLRIWDAATGRALGVRHLHGDRILDLEFGPHTGRLYSVGHDGFVRIWSPTGDRLAELPAPGRSAWACAVSPDERFLAVGYSEDDLRVWDLAVGTHKRLKATRWKLDTVGVAWSDTGETLASIDLGGTIAIRDPRTDQPRQLARIDGYGEGKIVFAGRRLVAARAGRIEGGEEVDRVLVIDPETGLVLRSAMVRGGGVHDLAAWGKGGKFATAHLDGRVRLWDSDTGDLVAILRAGDSGATQAGVAMADDHLAGIVDYHGDSAVRLWQGDRRRDLTPYLGLGEFRGSRFVWSRLLTAPRLGP
jgi:WD40 repeat protein